MGRIDEERWVRSDGHHLACRVRGDEEPAHTVLYCPGIFLPIERMWDDPVHARLLTGLEALGRVVVYDRRGIGASDPISDWDEPVVAQWARDAAAVIEDCGGTAHVFGWEWGGLQALLLARDHPDLVESVTLFHGIDRPERVETTMGMSVEEFGEAMAGWILGAGNPVELGDETIEESIYHPARAGDPAFERWINESGRRGASPSTAAQMWRSLCTADTGPALAEVLCPVLVLRRRECGIFTHDMGVDMVSALPDARLVELSGQDVAPYSGDVDSIVDEVHRFVAGAAPTAERDVDRRLCAVLFTDIVGSTERAAGLGDQRWRGVLDEHDQITSRIVGRHGGRVVKQTGDGTLAVFPLVSAAIASAEDVRAALKDIGIQIRQAVHVGEVMDRGDDVAGMTVHVAARLLHHAGAGEIVVTHAVPLALAAGPDAFEWRGEVEFRGVPGTWPVLVRR